MKKLWAVGLLLAIVAIFAFIGCDKDSIMPDSGQIKTPEEGGQTPAEQSNLPQSTDGIARITLYAMSECPFGIPAEKVVHKLIQALPGQLEARLVFIVGLDEEQKLRSLHGPTEVEKNMVQACVGNIDLEKQYDFVVAMNESQDTWQKLADDMGIGAAAVQKCMDDGTGEKILRTHLQETESLKVAASPTIIINGSRYEGPINSRDLFETICKTYPQDKASAACAAPPEILSRTDGAGAGNCGGQQQADQPLPEDMVDNTVFLHTVIYDSKAFDQDRMEEVIKQTLRLFPKMKVRKVDMNSREGKELIKKYEIGFLPAFMFPANFTTFKNFQMMQQYIFQVQDAFFLDPKIGANEFILRERIKKTVDIYFTPFSQKALQILLDVGELLSQPEIKKLDIQVNLRPYAPIENDRMMTKMGPPEMEEMQRVIAIMQTAPDKLWEYLKLRYPNPLSSWWEDFITQIGLDPATIKQTAQSDDVKAALTQYSKTAGEMGLIDEIAFVVENRELARVENKEGFQKLLEKLADR